MKNLFFMAILLLVLVTSSIAAQRKILKEVDTEALTTDTQASFDKAGDNQRTADQIAFPARPYRASSLRD